MLNDAKDELVRSNMVCRKGIDSEKEEIPIKSGVKLNICIIER
jgi:hypothetical protein